MLTQEDIQKITEANQGKLEGIEQKMDKGFEILSKEIFATRDDLKKLEEGISEKFSNLHGSVDAYAKKADTYFQEMVMLSHKIDRHEKWLLMMADKLGLKLDY